MNKSIEHMMNEHRLIVRVLGALDTLVCRLESGGAVPRTDVARFAAFFRDFADKLHHGKEEDRLFVALNKQGFPSDYGPVGVMLSEHTAGRTHVRALAEVGAGSGDLDAVERERVIGHAGEFVPLLLGHIQKEDNILYPMAQQAIPPELFQKLDEDCDAFDRSVMSAEQIEQLRGLGEALCAAYPADPHRMESAQACMGCAGHHA